MKVKFEWGNIRDYVSNQLENDEMFDLASRVVGTDWKANVIDTITDLYQNGIAGALTLEENQEIDLENDYMPLKTYLLAVLDQ